MVARAARKQRSARRLFWFSHVVLRGVVWCYAMCEVTAPGACDNIWRLARKVVESKAIIKIFSFLASRPNFLEPIFQKRPLLLVGYGYKRSTL
jgi:hypothetical protein